MSGGGALGAYEAGALWGLIKNAKNPDDFKYDVVSGVSAGSINALAVSLFEKGDEMNMVEWLSEKWASLTTPQVYVEWKPLGIITGLLDKQGVFDTTPLYNLLTGFINERGGVLKRMFEVSCVDVNDGTYTTFNETVSDPAKASVSSSSIPTIFPPQYWKNYDGKDVVCMDGGTVWNTNLVSAIKRCQEIVDDDSQITLDVILCGGSHLENWKD